MAEPQTHKGPVGSSAPWWRQKSVQWAIGILALLLAASVPLISMLLTRSSSTADELRKCMELRDLRTTPQKIVEEYPQDQWDRTGQYRKTTFASCSWPPSEVTAGDGYSEVVAVFARGPGGSESTSATYTDRVRATLHPRRIYVPAGGPGKL